MRTTIFLLALGLSVTFLSACGAAADESLLTDPAETFLCQAADLPAEGQYYLPSAGSLLQMPNESILVTGGPSEYEYLDVTGRLGGWAVQYQRKADVQSLPDRFYCGSVTYAAIQGAHVSVTKYNAATRGLSGWELTGEKVSLGDESIVLVYRFPDTTELRVWKVIEFSYRNVVIDVGGLGLDSYLSLGDLKTVAKAVLERLKAGTLVTPTPFAPMP